MRRLSGETCAQIAAVGKPEYEPLDMVECVSTSCLAREFHDTGPIGVSVNTHPRVRVKTKEE